MPNYWIFNVRDDENAQYSRSGTEIYNHRMQDCFWGLHEFTESGRRTANVAALNEGDVVLFYLAGKDGHCFLGTCVLASGFTKLRKEPVNSLTHKKFLDWDEGVHLKREGIEKWTNSLSIELLRGKVSFLPIGENYGSYLQGSVKSIRKQDFDTVMREHQPN
jgi:hypothetical protein